jgi:hypothetical protein
MTFLAILEIYSVVPLAVVVDSAALAAEVEEGKI